jgi:hypothetical protein
VSATGRGDEPLLARAAQRRSRQQMTDELLQDVARVYSMLGRSQRSRSCGGFT